MQILIELRRKNRYLMHSSEAEEQKFDRYQLDKLLLDLYMVGFRINSVFGIFLFNHKNKKVIDYGHTGKFLTAGAGLAKALLEGKAKMALIDTKKGYVVFDKRYFLAIQFCHCRRVRPLSVYTVNNNFKGLIIKENKRLLRRLYLESFIEENGDVKGLPTIRNEGPIKKGYSLPAPIQLENKEEDS